MATWTRYVTDQATNGVNPNSTLTLDGALGGTAPADYDPANITSIDLYLSLTGAGWSNDTWGATAYECRYTGGQIATGAISTSGNGNTTVTDGPDTDSTPVAGNTPDTMRATLTYNKSKGPDNGSVRIDNTSYIVITYTPAAAAAFDQIAARAYTDGDETDAVLVAGGATPTLKVGTLYHLRFEVEENGGGSGTFEAQLERQLNSGAWADVNAASTVVQMLKSWSVDTTGATSTNRLDTSAETFVGSAVNVDDGRVAPLTSFTGVTNFVFTVYIPAGDVTHGDTINLRVRNVNADGDPTYTQTLVVTVAETLTLPGVIPAEAHTAPETQGFFGPIIDSDGNLYVFTEPGFAESATTYGRGNPLTVAWKSENGGKSWRSVIGANAGSDTSDLEAISLIRTDPYVTGEVLFVKQSFSGGDANWYPYHTADHASTPDTFETDSTITMATRTGYDQNVNVLELANGHRLLTQGVLSTTERIGYRYWNGSTWAAIAYLDDAASTYINPRAETDGTRFLVAWKDQTNLDVYVRGIADGGTPIGTAQKINTLSTEDRSTEHYSVSDVVCYDPTNGYFLVLWKSADGTLYSNTVKWNGTSFDVGTETQVSTKTVDGNNPGGTDNVGATAALTADQATGIVYVFYADQATTSLWSSSWSEAGGWGSETSRYTANATSDTIGYVTANVITHSAGNGGATVVAYLYDLFDITAGESDPDLVYKDLVYDEFAAEAGSTYHNGAATLAGVGTVAAVGQVTHAAAASLAGAGILAVSGALVPPVGVAALSGVGTLVAAGNGIADGVAALAGNGAVTVAGVLVPPTGAVLLAGSGLVTAVGVPLHDDSGVLSGVGTLTAAPEIIPHDGSVVLAGAGTVDVTGSVVRDGAGLLAGTGTITGTGVLVPPVGTGNVAGTGTLAAAGISSRSTDAALAGVGTLQASPEGGVAGAALLSGTGFVSSSAGVIIQSGGSIAGEGRVEAVGTAIYSDSAVLAGAGTGAASGVLVPPEGTSTLNGSGTITATAEGATTGGAILVGAGSLVAAGQLVPPAGSAFLVGVGILDTSAEGGVDGSATLAGSGTVTVSATATFSGSAGLAGSGYTTGTGTAVYGASLSLSGVGTVTSAAGATAYVGVGAMFGVGAVTVAGSRLVTGAVDLDGTGTITVSSTSFYWQPDPGGYARDQERDWQPDTGGYAPQTRETT